jgi:tripartite-type tricarboxylate transporter receptor subunit TctC
MADMCKLIGVVLLLIATIMSDAAFAQQGWPNRNLRLIVPYAAGGTSDAICRALARRLSDSLGKPVIVENKPGGDTLIGTSAIVDSNDGHTFGFISDTISIHIAGNKRTPYDPQKDLIPIVQLAKIPFTFVVNAEQVSSTTLKDFVAHAKANPNWLSFASVGPGSAHELGFIWFKKLAGIEATIVPYRGLAPAMQDLLGGQVKALFWGGVANDQYVKAGKIRRLAVTSRTALDGAPEAEPIAATFPEYEFVSWYGLAAPPSMPAEAVRRLNEELNRAIQAPEVKELYLKSGILPAGGSPEDLAALMRIDLEKYRKIVRENNVKLD